MKGAVNKQPLLSPLESHFVAGTLPPPVRAHAQRVENPSNPPNAVAPAIQGPTGFNARMQPNKPMFGSAFCFKLGPESSG